MATESRVRFARHLVQLLDLPLLLLDLVGVRIDLLVDLVQIVVVGVMPRSSVVCLVQRPIASKVHQV